VTKLKDIKLSLNNDLKYKFPLINDKEKLPFKLTVTLEDVSPLPPNLVYNDADKAIEV
jgi:hypothetical protein